MKNMYKLIIVLLLVEWKKKMQTEYYILKYTIYRLAFVDYDFVVQLWYVIIYN